MKLHLQENHENLNNFSEILGSGKCQELLIHIHISLSQKPQQNLLNPKSFWIKVYKFVDIFLCRKTQKKINLFGFLCHRNDEKIQRMFITFASFKSQFFQIF
jgi:hypothetical protein